ncbi:TetR/AcrR family transcriptional regulator [Parasphingorhabdus sp.]|uniref:TetR/AcrR family transcriptional regulator n=1 Tax=Parasphingorhabdus sp. TaxID=2709688 RepID=UPI003262E7FA
MTARKPPVNSYHHGSLAPALIAAAEQELSQAGIESFSLRAVAKRAGVSHGAPAHHFDGKNGLLTALAAEGYRRLIDAQNERQKKAQPDPLSQLIASGSGYLDFAMQNQELFRLMLASSLPDRDNEHFSAVSMAAFDKLAVEIRNVLGTDPYTDRVAMTQVMASWSMVHGLAELIISGRTKMPMDFTQMPAAQRDAIFEDILLRALKTN